MSYPTDRGAVLVLALGLAWLVCGGCPTGGEIEVVGDDDAGDDDSDAQALEALFSLEQIHDIEIIAPEDSVAALTEEPKEYAPAAVTIDGVAHPEIGLRLKGNAGSFIPLGEDLPPATGVGYGRPGKSAFIFDFNRYDDANHHHGLEKLTLNNMVQDGSGIHEVLAYALFEEGGVPASRTGYASVTFNGEVKGLYLLLESSDNDTFLERWFGHDDGNLYEGVYGADFREEAWMWFDQDNGADGSMSDVKELVQALDEIGGGSEALAVLEEYLDLDEYLQFAASELYLGHWDGYAMSANNYKVHHDPEGGPWVFLPWGLDQTFVDWLEPHAGVMQGPGPSWEWGGRVHQVCFYSDACLGRLHDAFVDVIDRVEEMDLAGLAGEARALVEDTVVAEATEAGNLEDVEWNLAAVDEFIDDRGESIEAWLPCLIGGEIDLDGDGFGGCSEDCNDWDPAVFPGAEELCNFRDDDCNGIIDDPPECPDCLDVVGPDGRDYALCIEPLEWNDAEAYCQGRGQTLASIHDHETWEVLSWSFMELSDTWISWIGLHDQAEEGTFVWSDGSALDLVPWCDECPHKSGDAHDCVANWIWAWEDVECMWELPFVCGTP